MCKRLTIILGFLRSHFRDSIERKWSLFILIKSLISFSILETLNAILFAISFIIKQSPKPFFPTFSTIETTLAGKNHIKTIQKAKDLGYQVVLIYSYLDNPDFCKNRIKVRVLNGGHDIPHDDIVRRFYRSKENFWNIYKDLVDEWNLFYNGTSEYILVAQSVNNEIEIFSESLYNEFIKDFE